MENSFLILDDYDARILASKLGLAYTGTIGVILKGKESGLLPAHINYVQELRSAGFWMSKELEDRLQKDDIA